MSARVLELRPKSGVSQRATAPVDWSRNPLVERYLDCLGRALLDWRVPQPEIDEIVRDIDSHLAESQQSGIPLAEALTALGPADRLAEAYGVARVSHRPLDGGPSTAPTGPATHR